MSKPADLVQGTLDLLLKIPALDRKQLDREAANRTRLSDAISQMLRIEEA